MTVGPWAYLTRSRRALHRADRTLIRLAEVTSHVHAGSPSTRELEGVLTEYVHWLTDCSMVGTHVHQAGKAAGSPPVFLEWWRGMADDPRHRFFRDQRNAGLKDGSPDIVLSRPIGDTGSSYWAFPSGPHEVDPLVPRCQQYVDWLYYRLWAPAAERLFPWTLDEQLAQPFRLLP